MREALLLLITIKWAHSIVDMGLKPHVKTEITLLELHDPEIPKTSSHSANGFGFPGTVPKLIQGVPTSLGYTKKCLRAK